MFQHTSSLLLPRIIAAVMLTSLVAMPFATFAQHKDSLNAHTVQTTSVKALAIHLSSEETTQEEAINAIIEALLLQEQADLFIADLQDLGVLTDEYDSLRAEAIKYLNAAIFAANITQYTVALQEATRAIAVFNSFVPAAAALVDTSGKVIDELDRLSDVTDVLEDQIGTVESGRDESDDLYILLEEARFFIEEGRVALENGLSDEAVDAFESAQSRVYEIERVLEKISR